MIRFLQRQKAKKGFTIIEIIVVIALMGVMMAIILPMLSSANARKQEANSTARDFYSALQAVMTKYSMYEGPLSPVYLEEPEHGEMRYFESMGGNYPFKNGSTSLDTPATTSLYVEFATRNNEIREVYTYAIEGSDPGYDDGMGLFTLCQRSEDNLNTEFGKLLKSEIESRIKYQDGFYYAKITYKRILTGAIPAKMEAETVKVEYTGYCGKRLPSSANFTDFRNDNMFFGEDNRLANGDIFGVCTYRNPETGIVIGMEGTNLT